MCAKKKQIKFSDSGCCPAEKPIPEDIYPVIDTDLARDNLENDITDADLQDM